MKQGQAQSSGMGSTKREPTSNAVSPAAVSEIGIHQSRTVSQPLYVGRGIEAPQAATTVHESGSQGRHK